MNGVKNEAESNPLNASEIKLIRGITKRIKYKTSVDIPMLKKNQKGKEKISAADKTNETIN